MSEAVARLVVPAPAKVNLFLHVTGRRADGYHLLQSAFVLRCVVCRLGRHGVQYEAAWAIEARWNHEY